MNSWSAVYYPAVLSSGNIPRPAWITHMSLTSKACQVNWKKTTEAGRDHKETVLTSIHCPYYPFITTIIININSQCI